VTYGDSEMSSQGSRRRDFIVFVALVLGSAIVAIGVSTAVGLAIGAGFYDTGKPCHECEGCNP